MPDLEQLTEAMDTVGKLSSMLGALPAGDVAGYLLVVWDGDGSLKVISGECCQEHLREQAEDALTEINGDRYIDAWWDPTR